MRVPDASAAFIGRWLTCLLLLGCALRGQCTLAAPANVQTTSNCAGVTVAWNSVPFAAHYVVYRTQTASFIPFVNLGPVNATSILDTTAAVGTQYWYWVQTFCVVGAGGTTQFGVIGSRMAAPPTPSNVSATRGTSCAEVTVTWSAASGATQYRIYRDIGTTMPTTPIDTVGASPYVDTTGAAGITFHYWVQSVNACNPTAPQGNPAGGPDTGFRAVALAAPTGVAASDGSFCQYVRVTWNQVNGASGYAVWRNGAVLASNVLSPYDDFTAAAGTSYNYAVAALSAVSTCGSALSASNAGYRAAVPPPPTGVAAVSGPSCGTISVTWTPVAGATGYEVWRQGTPVPIAAVAGTSYTDAPPSANVWIYWVDAINNCGAGAASVSAQASSSVPSSFTIIGAGCPGSMPTSRLTLLQAPCIGTNLQVNFSNLPTNAGLLITGWSNAISSLGSLPLNMAPFGMPGCTAFVGDTSISLFAGIGNTAIGILQIPNLPYFVSWVFYQQALVLDVAAVNALGAVMSDAARFGVGG